LVAKHVGRTLSPDHDRLCQRPSVRAPRRSSSHVDA